MGLRVVRAAAPPPRGRPFWSMALQRAKSAQPRRPGPGAAASGKSNNTASRHFAASILPRIPDNDSDGDSLGLEASGTAASEVEGEMQHLRRAVLKRWMAVLSAQSAA